MFKYDKVIGKLEKFSERSKDKQRELLKKILTKEEYLTWQFDPGQNHQAYTNEMVSKFYRLLAYPSPMRVYGTLLDHYDKSTFSRSSIVVLNAILTFALQENNVMVQNVKDEFEANGSSVEYKDMEARTKKYAERIDELKALIEKLVKPYLKELSSETGLSRDMIYRALMVAPEPKYIPKHRITPITMHLLEELYSEASLTGFPRNGVKWRPLFVELFGVENLSSVAVSILLEGVHDIDQYRESKNLGAVRDCWDSLTMFALTELENTNDNVRAQMIDLYIKKAENKIARRQGRPITFRVNLSRLGREFNNLSRTVKLYENNFNRIFNTARYDQRSKIENDNRRRDNDRRDRPQQRDADRRPKDDDSPFDDYEDEKDSGGVIEKAGKLAKGIADTLSRIAGDDEDY